MKIIKEIIFYVKHYFDRYKIYVIGNKGYVVKDCLYGKWIDRGGLQTWSCKEYINDYCLVKTCKEAHDLILSYKKYQKSCKESEKIARQNNKIKFARKCYKD